MEEKIYKLLKNNKYLEAKELINKLDNDVIASYIDNSLNINSICLFRLIDKEKSIHVFNSLSIKKQNELLSYIIDNINDREMNELINNDFLEEMPASIVNKLLKKTNNNKRININKLLGYQKNSVGYVMDSNYAYLMEDMTIKEALSKLRHEYSEYESLNTCYVIDKNHELLGEVSLKDIILAKSTDLIKDIYDKQFIYTKTNEKVKKSAKVLKKLGQTVMPVVDKENCLVGIIEINDTNRPYFDISIFDTAKTRIPWLLLLMISATFTSAIISGFEEQLAIVPILTAYIPMLIGTGGNAGSQASVTIIRSLSLNQVDFNDLFRIIWKELKVSIIVGFVLAAINYIKLILVDRIMLGYDISNLVCLSISLSILFIVIMAKFIGCSLPILVKKMGFDPAVVANPFITTIIDALGLILYFSIANMLLL